MGDPFAKESLIASAERWKQFNWFILTIICGIGLCIVVSVGFGFFRGAQLYRKYVPLIDASMEMRLEATTAYLWFEEMVGGDTSKNLDDILKRLNSADWYANAMLEGGASSHLKLLPLDEPTLRESIKTLQGYLKEQRELLNSRIVDLQTSRPGSDIDKVYHSALERFIAHADNFEMEIKGLMARNFRLFKYISLGVISFCIFLFFIIGYGFWRYENLRRKNYSDLLDMEQLLVKTERMASLGRMITGIAHEINNPNNFISFNIPILREYLQGLMPIVDDHAAMHAELEISGMSYLEFREDLYKLMDNIESGSSRVNRIVSNLKDFSRKKDRVNKEWIDLNRMIGKVIDTHGPKLSAMVDQFDVSVVENLPPVYCDQEIVASILVNFLSNAAESVDKPNRWIKLNVFADEKRNNALVIEVTDNGCGIDNRDLKKIFDPFYSTKSARGGTGMGLYLCQTMADQMGAAIEVVSETGRGSTFRLIIDGDWRQN